MQSSIYEHTFTRHVRVTERSLEKAISSLCTSSLKWEYYAGSLK